MIRQANTCDVGHISRFLERAALLHRHLDWRTVLDWVEVAPFLLHLEDNKISGLLSCAPDPEGIAWIHCFAAGSPHGYEAIWQSLLQYSLMELKPIHARLCSVGLNDWFNTLLQNSGFTLVQNIVVLLWQGVHPKSQPLSKKILTRPMEPADIPQVCQVDTDSFEPMWRFSHPAIEMAYSQSDHSTVAESEGQVIAYELSTSNHFTAHLARLAVSPAYTQGHIGFTLARQMLLDFSKRGISQVSVNTQDTNSASLSLYKKLGFVLSGDSFPVFCLMD